MYCKHKPDVGRREGENMFKSVVLSTIVLATMAGALASPVSADAPDKVFVCKYVGTPNVDERLQTGNNPISVSVNSIKPYNGVGSYFADAQGQSYVLAVDTRTGNGQEGEPNVNECPTPRVPVTPGGNGNPQNPVVPGGQGNAPTQPVVAVESDVLPAASGDRTFAYTLIAAGLATIVTGIVVGFNALYRRSV